MPSEGVILEGALWLFTAMLCVFVIAIIGGILYAFFDFAWFLFSKARDLTIKWRRR